MYSTSLREHITVYTVTTSSPTSEHPQFSSMLRLYLMLSVQCDTALN